MKSLAITTTALASIMAITMVSAGSNTASAQPADMTLPLQTTDITHALGRLTFGASPNDHQQWLGQSRDQLIAHLMEQLRAPNTHQPAFLEQRSLPDELVFLKNEALGELAIGVEYFKVTELAAWQVAEMAVGDTPFREAMTWFWMDHFVTSFDSSEDAKGQKDHLDRIQAHMTGGFGDMLADQLQSPALLTYLNNEENTVDAPNENLAREVLELFTLGRDRGYSESDIREIARALTGHGVSDDWSGYEFHAQLHDNDLKEIFGQRGNFDAPDLPMLILDNPAFGPHVAEKLWLYFVSPTPDTAEIERWTAEWRAANWDLPTLYKSMLTSQAFWSANNRGTLVKSPIELIASTARTFGMRLEDPQGLIDTAADTGQMLFLPPNVAGWNEGNAWITDASLIARTSLMSEFAETFGEEIEVEANYQPEPFSFTEIQNGVRVGTAAVEWAELWNEPEEGASGQFLSLVVGDLGVDGATADYAVIQLGVESFDGETESYINVDLEFCGQGCAFQEAAQMWEQLYGLTSVDDEQSDDAWVYVNQWGDSQNFDLFNEAELKVLDGLVSNLPDLVRETAGDINWQYMIDEAAEEARELGEDTPVNVMSAAQAEEMARNVLASIKRGDQDVLNLDQSISRGFSTSQPWGVSNQVASMILDSGISLSELEEQEANGTINLDEVDLYGSAEFLVLPHLQRLSDAAQFLDFESWVEALPPSLRTAEALTEVVLAVPPANQPTDTLVQDADGFLKALLTDPRFNLK